MTSSLIRKFLKNKQCYKGCYAVLEECMPVEANLQKILIRHINFDTQNRSAKGSDAAFCAKIQNKICKDHRGDNQLPDTCVFLDCLLNIARLNSVHMCHLRYLYCLDLCMRNDFRHRIRIKNRF